VLQQATKGANIIQGTQSIDVSSSVSAQLETAGSPGMIPWLNRQLFHYSSSSESARDLDLVDASFSRSPSLSFLPEERALDSLRDELPELLREDDAFEASAVDKERRARPLPGDFRREESFPSSPPSSAPTSAVAPDRDTAIDSISVLLLRRRVAPLDRVRRTARFGASS
jgi:hypothetical protein